MAVTMDLKKINKTIRIFAVAQAGLMALLIFMAVNFQQRFQMLGKGPQFMSGVVVAFVIQMLVLYPIYTFAAKEAGRDFSLIGRDLNPEETKAFAKKKRWADAIKMSVFGFYFIFILALKTDHPLILSVIYYSFILTILSYLQSYNFAAKRLARGAGERK